MNPSLTPLTLAVAGWIGVSAVMAALWAIQFRTRNAGIVDAGWTFGVGGLAVFYAVAADGALGRRAAIAGVMAIWSLRLGFYLVRDRIVGSNEDGRYQTLRREWGARAATRFFWFFQAQALAAVFFSLPALIASINAEPSLAALERIALALWFVGFAGETLADLQLERFKSDNANRGRTCRAGLWRYSRHPNYFFEWTMWMAYGIFALGSPWGAVALLCPAAMLYLLFKVTGIPATEAQAMLSRGDDYRHYQRTTSVFFPWFPRA